MKILQIKKSQEFQKIGKKGEKFYSQTLILLSSQTSSIYFQDLKKDKKAKDFCRIGYTVSKNVGDAVARNRAKRRLRQAFKTLAAKCCKNHYDYVIIARKEIATSDFKKILNDLKFCLTRIHKPKSNEKNHEKRF